MPEHSSNKLKSQNIVIVTGMSGAGKSTALRGLEDLGYEAVDNAPLSLIERFLLTDSSDHPIAIGVDIRTRGFDARASLLKIKELAARSELKIQLLFIDCNDDILVRRFEETRRRHPLALDRPVSHGIREERSRMAVLRIGAALVIDTTEMKQGHMKPLLKRHFCIAEGGELDIFVISFGFKYGLPQDADLVFDVRFLKNPYYEQQLSTKTGLDTDVADFVRNDEGFGEFSEKLKDMLSSLFPRYSAEGKSYLTIAIGCTGGRHRSVCLAEELVLWASELGKRIHLHHRDLEN